ncbi:dihydropteroate synthase [Niveispirillum lacus]|uniref:Dihydropteroate synthase n=1 Tax=Niveispirillum lacus TaxID=1981099 RepID=A0A255YTT6_9PROT|nr:dihydropteroate synthase [Niveispirillum lacus]OYQ32633.1 dihydropteroate synthase [Niveispirillum lacus]
MHCPLALFSGPAARAALALGMARPLAGSPLAFTLVETAAGILPATALPLDHPLTMPRSPWAGFDLSRPLIMGIVNVTPDSFSDGGDHENADAAIAHGRRLLAEGADILDIGGESTRPGAAPVPVAVEIARVVPVIRALAAEGAVISIDTRHAAVMQAAAEAGARIINDVTALTGDPDSLSVAAATGLPVILMHIQGEPQTMQDAPHYDDVIGEVLAWLAQRIDAAVAAGIGRDRIAIDPGIGFGKDLSHNVALLARTAALHGLGCPLLIGVSRKRFIAALSAGEAPKDRVAGSIAAALHSLGQGAHILRVHDVAATMQAVAVWQALQSA